MDNENQEEKTYKVVKNEANEHSIWPADRENAEGWNDAGKTGTRAECMSHVNEAFAGGSEKESE